MNNELITIEVAYGLPDRQFLRTFQVAYGCTAEEAIRQSGMLDIFPELQNMELTIGIFSKKIPLDTVLNNGDRVECYRPLLIDPKENRRIRSRKSKAT